MAKPVTRGPVTLAEVLGLDPSKKRKQEPPRRRLTPSEVLAFACDPCAAKERQGHEDHRQYST